MANSPLLRDAFGNVIMPGRVKKVLTEPFLVDTALPAWLTSAGGTVSVSDTSAGRGELSILSATAGKASVQTTTGINLAYCEAVRWDVEGFWADSIYASFAMGLNNQSGANAGVYVTQGPGATMAVKLAGGTQVGTIYYDVQNGIGTQIREITRMRNVSLMLTTATKHLYVLEDDQVMADVDLSAAGLSLGVINPVIQITATDGGQHTMHISQLRLTVSGF